MAQWVVDHEMYYVIIRYYPNNDNIGQASEEHAGDGRETIIQFVVVLQQ